MTIKITQGSIVSDGHVVLMPPGVTGSLETSDGTAYDLGDANTVAIEVDSHDHAKEIAFEISQLVHASDAHPDIEHEAAQSRKNLGLTKKKD